MRIAIPVADGRLAPHFGHSVTFCLIDADPAARCITGSTEVAAPEHQPGLLPPWLKERGVDVVIARGMGARARSLFEAASVEVFTGVPDDTPAALVSRYLAGTLISGPNVCDHDH